MTRQSIHDMVGKFVRFCLVGSSGLIVDMGILFLFADPRTLGWPIVISKVLAAETAMINNFVWNELWTFRDRARLACSYRSRFIRLAKFNLICSGGIAISVITLKVLIDWLDVYLYLADFVAIVVATGWNFGMNYTFNWRKGQAETNS